MKPIDTPTTKKKRKKRPVRSRKPVTPVGAPKKFSDPVRVHFMIERADLDRLDQLAQNASKRGNCITRSDAIRFCVRRLIGGKFEV